MTLPDKAIEAGDKAKEKFLRFRPDSVSDRTMTGDIIQAAINALWITFDADDPDTWPNNECAPSGRPWMIWRPDYIGEFELGIWKGKRTIVWKHCKYYTDPAYITPTETE